MARSRHAWRWHCLAMSALLAVTVLRWHAHLLYPGPAVDESAYLGAFVRASAGLDPYAVERFIYPPPFAFAGGAILSIWGQPAVLAVLRALDVLGACALVWVSLAMTAWRRGPQLAAGIGILLVWAPIHLAFDAGNISPAVIGASLAALALAPRRPIVAGCALALGLVTKPVALPVVLSLGAWRNRPASDRRWAPGALAAAAALLLAAAVTLAIGTEPLRAMLAKTAVPPTPGHTLSLWRLLYCLGLHISPTWLLVAIMAPLLWWLRRRQLSIRALTVVASTAAIYVLPLVWTHTLALSLPAQLLAFESAFQDVRTARPLGGPPLRRAILTLAILIALALTIQGSHALISLNDRPLLLQALAIAPAVLAPTIFAIYGLSAKP